MLWCLNKINKHRIHIYVTPVPSTRSWKEEYDLFPGVREIHLPMVEISFSKKNLFTVVHKHSAKVNLVLLFATIKILGGINKTMES